MDHLGLVRRYPSQFKETTANHFIMTSSHKNLDRSPLESEAESMFNGSPDSSSTTIPTNLETKSISKTFILVHNMVKMTNALPRPSDFRKSVIRFFKLHLDMCGSIGSISFAWNKERNEFGPVTNKLRRMQFNIHMTIAIVHNIFMIWNLFTYIGKFKVSYKMLGIYFTSGYCLCNGLRLFARIHEKEIIKLMNANFTFEENIRAVKKFEEPDSVLQKLLKSSARSQKSLVILGLITGISVPILVFFILLANPCQPPFIGSLVFEYTQDDRCIVHSWSLHFAIALANFWMHLDMVLPMVFTMFGLFFLSVSCLHDYIEFLKRKMMSKLEARGDTLLNYRRVQIMEKQLNTCFRQGYFPLLLSGMTTLLIFCLYSCIRLHDKIPMPGFSYFPMVALDGIVSILVMNTKAANVLGHSLDLIKKFRNDPHYKRNHWTKKMSCSLTPLKINFMMNFVDKSTPLIFINFSLNQVVSLLLMGSERKHKMEMEDVLAA